MLTTFIDSVQDQGRISPQRLGKRLIMPVARLAKIARLHRNTLSGGKSASPFAQERLGEIAQIIGQAAELAGDEGRAIVWFRHQPIAGFSGRTAEQLVTEGKAHAVIEYLESLEAGAYT